MFREALGYHQTVTDEPVWPVLNREEPSALPTDAPQQPAEDKTPFLAMQAAPDVPAAVGVLLFGAYLALIGALAIATAGPGQSGFALVIAALFVVAFFSVPRFIMAQEPKQGRPSSMEQFLAKGLETYTGHCSGKAALVEMFVVPVLLTCGILSIGLIIAVS